MTSPLYTATEKRVAIERELRHRRRVYDRLVGEGKMTPTRRQHEIAIMEAIAEDYRALESADELPF